MGKNDDAPPDRRGEGSISILERLSGFVRIALWLAAGAGMLLGTLGLTMGYDVWFHLVNGAKIVADGAIPHVDHWLVPLPGVEPRFFPNYEWLFGVVLHSAWRVAGYAGIDLLRGILILTAFLFAALASQRRAAHSGLARSLVPALLLLGFAAASSRFEPRPHLVSAAGLALMTLLVRAPGRISALCLVPAAVFWANCHIEILFGIGYAAIWLIPGQGAGAARWESSKYSAVYIVILVAAVAFSPAGPSLVGQAGAYYEGERMIRSMGFWNVELTPMVFEPLRHPGPLLVLIAFVALVARTIMTKRVCDPETLSAAAFIILPFISNRYIISSSVVLIPFLAGIPGEVRPRDAAAVPSPGQTIAGALGIAAVLLFAPMSFLPGTPSRPHAAGCSAPAVAYDRNGEFPDAALRFLNRNGIGERLFSHDRWGNFVMFYDNPCPHRASAPARLPYMNAMFQTMPRERIERYLHAIVDENAWRGLSREAGIDTVLLPHPDGAADPWHGFLRRMAFNPDWKLVRWDDVAFVYLASASAWFQRGGRAFEAARPDRWLVTGEFPDTPEGRAAALVELAESRREPEGGRVVRTLQWMGGLMLRDGQASAAIRLLEPELNAIAPGNKALNAILGEAYGRVARWDDAFERLSVAAREPASSASLFFNLAVAAAQCGRLDDASSALDRSLACDPAFSRAVELRTILAGSGADGF